MKLTNLQVINALQSLKTLSQKSLPFKLAFKVSTATDSLESFAKRIEDTLNNIRVKYAMKNDAGDFIEAIDKDGNAIPNTLQIPTEKISVANKELEEVLNLTVEVLNVSLNFTDFPETLELQPSTLNALLPLIKENATNE